MQNKPTTAEIIILVAGAAALLFSFFDWLDFGRFGGGANAWDEGFLPTYTLVGIFGAGMAVFIALEIFANVKLPENVLGFSMPQVHLVLADYTALLTLSFLIVEKSGADMGIGFFISLIASIGLVVGAFMLGKERPNGVRVAPAAGGGAAPPPQAPPPQAPPPQAPPPGTPPPAPPA